MDQKPLGRSGRTISSVGLGTVTFGREIDEERSYELMDYALQKGLTWFDTSEDYGGGQSQDRRNAKLNVQDQREVTTERSSSEKIIGRWLKKAGNRDDVTLCTKISGSGSSAPDNITRAVTGSLDRLGTDRLDIYMLHVPTPQVPIAETLHALTEEVNAGRIGVIGCSNFSAAQLQEALDASAAHGHARFEIVSPPYNLVYQDDEDDLFPLCTKEGIALTPHSPLGNGFLTGKYSRDGTRLPPRSRFDIVPAHIDLYFRDSSWRVLELLRAKSAELGVPMVKLAMAWTMSHPDVTGVLVGGRETRHIDNGIEAYNEGLDPELRAEMSAWTEGAADAMTYTDTAREAGAAAKPESTEGGRRVSVLKRQEGAPVNLG